MSKTDILQKIQAELNLIPDKYISTILAILQAFRLTLPKEKVKEKEVAEEILQKYSDKFRKT